MLYIVLELCGTYMHMYSTYTIWIWCTAFCNPRTKRYAKNQHGFSASPRRRSATRSPPARSSWAPRAPMGPSCAKPCQAVTLIVSSWIFSFKKILSNLCLTHISTHVQNKYPNWTVSNGCMEALNDSSLIQEILKLAIPRKSCKQC